METVDVVPLKAGQHIKLVWEDEHGTVQSDDVTVLATFWDMLHFIHGSKPKMVPMDRVWSYEQRAGRVEQPCIDRRRGRDKAVR